MSLKQKPIASLPELTCRVAKASFPNGNFYIELHDKLGSLFEDALFSELFPNVGRPACEPWRLAFITLFQFAEALNDRQAADAVRARLDWKYILHLELDDDGFDFSVLSQFRSRLLENHSEALLFDLVLQKLENVGLLDKSSNQRSDSTHVLASIRNLNRAECVGETLRTALNVLATISPDWIRQHVPPAWFSRYEHPFSEFRMPKSEKKKDELIFQIGQDGHFLLERILEEPGSSWLAQVPAIETLRKVWIQNYYHENQVLRWRTNKQLPPSSLQIRSPHDEEARRGKKREMNWVGYKVHLTETCAPDLPKLVTNVETTNANQVDIEQTEKIHQALGAKGFHPEKHFVDKGYTSGEQLVNSEEEYNIKLIGPVAEDSGWQNRVDGGVTASQFRVDWEKKEALCPEGKKSKSWADEKTKQGKEIFKVKFSREDCGSCECREKCTKSTISGRVLTLRPQAEKEAIEKRREEQKSKEFKEEYKRRSGVEGVHSQSCNGMEMRRTRYKGEAKAHLQHLMTAAAINLQRAIQWIRGIPSSVAGISRFAALAT